MKRIGLVGVPVESLFAEHTCAVISAYLPGLTEATRKRIVENASGKGLTVEDLGELKVGEFYKPGFLLSKKRILPFGFKEELKSADIAKIEEERLRVLEQAKQYDLLIATGPSHLGAIVLYDSKESVARLDYHSDFFGWDSSQKSYSYASYMDWVRFGIKRTKVTNYFVMPCQKRFVFGKMSEESIMDDSYKRANHFDIDVDCFELSYHIQDRYSHHNGPTGATPELVLSMIQEAKPKKIGIWEYRPDGDYDQNGLEFIVAAIQAAVKN